MTLRNFLLSFSWPVETLIMLTVLGTIYTLDWIFLIFPRCLTTLSTQETSPAVPQTDKHSSRLMIAKYWMAFSLLCDWLKNIHSTNQILRPKLSRLGHVRFPALSANLVLGRSKKELHFQIIRKSTDIEWKKTSFNQRW